MITKESAMHIYNLHSQIEKTNEIINKLKEVKDNCEKNAMGIDIVTDGWKNYRSIQLEIPEQFFRSDADHSFNGARIYQISVPDSILILENHIIRLNKALEDANKKAVEE